MPGTGAKLGAVSERSRYVWVLGGEVFTTQAAIRERCRAIIHGYPRGARLSDEHRHFALDLVEYHPDPETKIGTGIDWIYIDYKGPTPCFHIRRLDGSFVDFSFEKMPQHPNPMGLFKRAARESISDQTMDYRGAEFARQAVHLCPLSGLEVGSDEAHIDHYPTPFDRLIKDFIDACSIEVDAVVLPEGPQGLGRCLPEEIARDWRAFHLEHARYRLVSRRAHLAQPRSLR